jgi:hypothetical protein
MGAWFILLPNLRDVVFFVVSYALWVCVCRTTDSTAYGTTTAGSGKAFYAKGGKGDQHVNVGVDIELAPTAYTTDPSDEEAGHAQHKTRIVHSGKPARNGQQQQYDLEKQETRESARDQKSFVPDI